MRRGYILGEGSSRVSVAKILGHEALQGFDVLLWIIPVGRAMVRPLGKVGLHWNVVHTRLLDDLMGMDDGYEFVIRSMNKQDGGYVKILRFLPVDSPSFHTVRRARYKSVTESQAKHESAERDHYPGERVKCASQPVQRARPGV